ncbi:MAG: hypothetical protein WD316_12875 [Phycisphaeraceae bacterium]
MTFRTYHHSGGTNAAGDTIPGGSFDPILELFNSSRTTSFGMNDDFNAPNRDSLLSWPGFTPNPEGANTPLNPDPLPDTFYSLQLRPFSAPASGNWALDIVTDGSGIDFSGIETNAGSTISSLKFGYTGTGGSGPRVQNIDLNGPETITGELVVGVIGRGRYEVHLGTTNVGGLTTVNADSRLGAYTNGTFNANGGALIDGGTLETDTGGVFNLGANQTLTANNNATITLNANHAVGGGSTYLLNSGSDMEVIGTLELGHNTTGRGEIRADGNGTSLQAGNVLLGFAGAGSELRFSNHATGTLSSVTVATDFLTTGTSTLLVQSNADVTTDNLTIGTAQSSAATGNLSVFGNGSTLTQNGASTMTVGSADPDNFAAGTVEVFDNGQLSTGTGDLLIRKSGSVFINTGGTFNAKGDLRINGGSLTVGATGILNPDGNVTLDDGTLDLGNIPSFFMAANKSLTAMNNSQITSDGALHLFAGQTATLESGSDMMHAGFLAVGTNNGNGTLTVQGSGSTLDITGESLEITIGGTGVGIVNVQDEAALSTETLFVARAITNASTDGTLNILSGGDVTTGFIGLGNIDGNEGTGTIDVDGSGSTLTQTGTAAIILGNANTANHAVATHTINVTSDAVFNTGTGTTTIRKTGTLNINTGGEFNANGKVNVNGGTINTDDTASAFDMIAGGTLTATNDAQINFNGPRYTLGFGRTFNIESGSDFVAATGLDIGAGNTGTLVVDGSGSTLDVNGGTAFLGFNGGTADVTIRDQASAAFDNTIFLANLGNDSTGTIRVESGATMTAQEILLADDTFGPSADATATITVTGDGSTLTQQGGANLKIGGTGTNSTATINVSDNAVFNTGTGTTTINQNGAINLNGGTLRATTIDHTAGGQFNFTAGTLQVVTFDGDLAIPEAGTVTGGGTITGNVSNAGLLSPGNSPGVLTINGGFTQAATGTLEILLAGSDPGTGHDQLAIEGATTLAGTLAASLDPDFTPTPWQAFDILTADEPISGAFDTLELPDSLTVHYSGGVVSLVAAGLVGDMNLDGVVDAVDVAPFVQALTDPAAYQAEHGVAPVPVGDINGDGVLDAVDVAPFVQLLVGAESASVPEPTSGGVLTVGALMLLPRRRRSALRLRI